MPELTPFYLTFRSGLHLGTKGLNLEEAGIFIPSDTLFAAILDTLYQMDDQSDRLIAPFVAKPPQPPFLLTSAFPFAGSVRFYPMPLDLSRLFREKKTFDRYGKKIKRIQFFSEGLLRQILAGEALDDRLFEIEHEYAAETGQQTKLDGEALQGGALWLTRAEFDTLPEALKHYPNQVWKQSQVARVTVSRIRPASTIFHSGRVAFGQDCGLWFGVQWRTDLNDPWREVLPAVLQNLSVTGLGGERSIGFGPFRYSPGEPFSLPDPRPQAFSYLLSRYNAQDDTLPATLKHPRSAYQIVIVGGWLRTPTGSAQRRKKLAMISEGSLLALPSFPAGEVSDVTPSYNGSAGLPHKVYRSGLALAIGWPGNLDKEV